jgi:hypothetical protein
MALGHDRLVRACRHAHQAAVAEVAVDKRRLARVDGDDGPDPAHLSCRAFATCLTPALVHARDLGWGWMAGQVHLPAHGASDCSARKRSAWIAAIAPDPAATTIWRKSGLCTSPAANTPGTPVRWRPSVTM